MVMLDGELGEKSRLRALLDHFSVIEDPRDPWRVAHPLPEVLLLVVCASIADCDDFEAIALWGAQHLGFLRRFLPYHHGVPCARWLTLLMNRLDANLFQACFTAWVREVWPDRPELIAIDGKTSRRSHDRHKGTAPLHLVSAFATTSRLVLGQEAVSDKSNEIIAIPELVERLAEAGAIKGALITIDAIACNATVADSIIEAGGNYLLAVKANQPTLRSEIEAFFNDAPPETLSTDHDIDKGHGRIEQRTVTVAGETGWLNGQRRFPGEIRLPGVKTIVKVASRTELKEHGRFDTRFYISSAELSAKEAANAVRGHWAIENQLHWVLDVVFNDDLARLRTGHGAKNMAVVRHFAINLVRQAKDKNSIKLRRKLAGWNDQFLASILDAPIR
jgi:predicted transposase YbfD/YdcC